MKKSGIYLWSLHGIPKYVGKSVDVHQRMLRNHSDSEALNRAIEKHGYDAFEKEVLCYCDSTELNELEEFYIRKLGTHRSIGGYNLTLGADGQSAGEAHPFYGVTGENHPSWGRKNSQKTLEKMSASHRERQGPFRRNPAKNRRNKEGESKPILWCQIRASNLKISWGLQSRQKIQNPDHG